MKPIEWLKQKKYIGVIILDKCAWRSKNHWETKITEENFINKLYKSTCFGICNVYNNDKRKNK